LWPHDAVFGVSFALRDRLRQLQRRTARNLHLFDPDYSIVRPRGGRVLFIHFDGRNFVQKFFGENE
jgi:hypothetical protein